MSLGRRVAGAKHWLLQLLFGDDLFVSYATADGAAYAEELAIAFQAHGFVPYLNKWHSWQSEQLPLALRARLARASMLVLIATPAAKESPFVAREIDEYRAIHRFGDRSIVAVDLGLDAAVTAWAHGVGRTVVAEQPGARRPSADTVEEVRRSVSFTRQSIRQRRVAGSTAALIAVMVTAGVIAGRSLQKSAHTAALERDAANAQRAAAKNDLARLARDKRKADAELRVAQSQATEAGAHATEAARKAAAATTLEQAEELAASARLQQENDPELSLLLALAAGERATTPEVVRSLRNTLARYVPFRSWVPRESGEDAVCITGDAEYVAISALRTRLWNTRTSQIRAPKTAANAYAMACSPSGDQILLKAYDTGGLFLVSASRPEHTTPIQSSDHFDKAAYVGDGRAIVTAKVGDGRLAAQLWSTDGAALTPLRLFEGEGIDREATMQPAQRGLVLSGRESADYFDLEANKRVPLGRVSTSVTFDGSRFIRGGNDPELWTFEPLRSVASLKFASYMVPGPRVLFCTAAEIGLVQLRSDDAYGGGPKWRISDDVGLIPVGVMSGKLATRGAFTWGAGRAGLELWDPQTGLLLKRLDYPRPFDLVHRLASTGDGRHVVALGSTPKRWSVAVSWDLFERHFPASRPIVFDNGCHPYLLEAKAAAGAGGAVLDLGGCERDGTWFWGLGDVAPRLLVERPPLGPSAHFGISANAEWVAAVDKRQLYVMSGGGVRRALALPYASDVDAIAVSGDGTRVALLRRQSRVLSILKLSDKDLAPLLEVETRHPSYGFADLTFTADHAFLLSSGYGTSRLYDVRKLERGTPIEAATPKIFGRDERAYLDQRSERIVTANSKTGDLHVWTRGASWAAATTARAIADAGLHVAQLATTTDGAFVATVDDAGAIRIWDANLGGLVQTLGPPLAIDPTTTTPHPAAIAFVGDTTDLASLWTSGVARVDACDGCADGERLVALARRRARRALTAAERATYGLDRPVASAAR